MSITKARREFNFQNHISKKLKFRFKLEQIVTSKHYSYFKEAEI